MTFINGCFLFKRNKIKYFTLVLLLIANLAFSQYNYELVKTIQSEAGAIYSLKISTDGNTLISGHIDGSLIFWNINSLEKIKKIDAHADLIGSINFDNKGDNFTTTGHDGKAILWDYNSLEPLETYILPYEGVNFAIFANDSSLIVGGYSLQRGRVLTMHSEFTALYEINLTDNNINELYNTHKKNLYFFGEDWGITDGIFDMEKENFLMTKGYALYAYNFESQVAFKYNSAYNLGIISAYENDFYTWGQGYLTKWRKIDDDFRYVKSVLAGDSIRYCKIEISNSGQLLLTGNDKNYINLWDSNNLNKVNSFSASESVRAFAFAKNDSIIISGDMGGDLNIYKIPSETGVQLTVGKTEEIIYDEYSIPLKIKDRVVEKQGTFTVNKLKFEIEVWDNLVYDHDTISLNINGEWILRNYEVTKTKRKIDISIKPNTINYLILYVHNLGDNPPNTAAIGLNLNNKPRHLVVSSDLQKCGALNFEFKP